MISPLLYRNKLVPMLCYGVAMLDFAHAQSATPTLTTLGPEDLIAPQDDVILTSERERTLNALNNVTARYGSAVVVLTVEGEQVALGTIIAPGIVVTKLSEYNAAKQHSSVVLSDAAGKVYDYRGMLALPEYDVLVLDVPSLTTTPIDLESVVEPDVGSFLATVAPSGQAMEYGVVSVGERSLREEDLPYLGVAVDPQWKKKGVLVVGVEAGAGAHRSGLRAGDILIEINGKEVTGAHSVRASMVGIKPGAPFPVAVMRDGQLIRAQMIATQRPQKRKFPQRRLEVMNAMGNPRSIKRDEFPSVIQTDIPMHPSRAGCPVVDLEGRVLGIGLSRAGRIETYVLPLWVCYAIVSEVMPRLSNDRTAPRSKPQEISEKEVPLAPHRNETY